MSKLRLEDSDLIMNKSPRMPICIVIETSDEILSDASMIRNINKGMESLIREIQGSLSLQSLADICVISFGTEAVRSRAFGTLKPDEVIEPKPIGGTPDLSAALTMAVKELQLRLNDYEKNGVKRYTPVLFILGSDLLVDEFSPAFSQINHWSRTGKLSVIPVAIGEQQGNSLSRLTVNGEVFQMNSMNYDSIFSTLGKSIEMLSRSSANAVESLQLKSIDWNDFKRK